MNRKTCCDLKCDICSSILALVSLLSVIIGIILVIWASKRGPNDHGVDWDGDSSEEFFG